MYAFSIDRPRAREHDALNPTRHTHPAPVFLAAIHIRRSPVCRAGFPRLRDRDWSKRRHSPLDAWLTGDEKKSNDAVVAEFDFAVHR